MASARRPRGPDARGLRLRFNCTPACRGAAVVVVTAVVVTVTAVVVTAVVAWSVR
ncbi:hypothetical protein GCM10018785_57350 [Streptomyces longispororuber]|uniref:Uncharacterized protein n=1 Tax=Streptomyces longispororuber TaxID=68230 RepID=A0A919DUQ7_9ACTN|nr:hypothetical protein GCM10018785_57350 [Streptomyces longispororuber]